MSVSVTDDIELLWLIGYRTCIVAITCEQHTECLIVVSCISAVLEHTARRSSTSIM